jgi:multiple sugar transport system permease protein
VLDGLLLLAVVVWLFPIFWMVVTSLKTRLEAFAFPPVWLFHPTLESYVASFTGGSSMWIFLQNSVIVALGSTVVTVAAGAPAAYVLARFQVRGKHHLSFWILSSRFAPAAAIVLPMFLLLRRVGLLDTYAGMVAAYTALNLPLAVWLLRGFFADLPRDVEESALIDGSTHFGAFWRVALPLAVPGVVATAIFAAIFAWNEFLLALVLTGINMKTMPVAIIGFWTTSDLRWGQFMATGTVTVLTILLFALLVQRFLVRAMTLGALKG